MRKDLLSDLATYVIALCAIVIAGLAVRNEFYPPRTDLGQERPIREWRGLAAEGHQLGSVNAPVQVVEFSDFECPFCARAESAMRVVQSIHRNRINVSYLHFPLTSIHEHAFKAAIASECAGRQGRFAAYHDLLFSQHDSIGLKSWERFAIESGVPDLKSFRLCVDTDEPRSIIERHVVLGRELGFAGTPAFIIDGTLYPNGLSTRELTKHLEVAAEAR